MEKLNCISGRLPAFHQWMRGDHVYAALDGQPNLKVIKAPYQASPVEHPIHEAWKAFTGSSCPAYKPISQATAYRPQVILKRKRPSMIPPAPLQVQWHPEDPWERNASLPPNAIYGVQMLANGQMIYEMSTPISPAGGEEIPGLWRFSGYHQDGTIYFSVVLKVTEETDMPQRPSSRKRKADDDGQYQVPSKKRLHVINE